MERAGIAGDEIRCDEEGRRPEPRGLHTDRDAVATHQPPRGADQTRRAKQGIEAPRHRAQQRVPRDTEGKARPNDLEAEPGPDADRAHPATASDSPPNRRSRA